MNINLQLIRQLALCFQAFEQLDSKRIRESGLTPSQFDIIATLGNTQGMCCKELGDKTLITKGTLTSVIDRLISKELVERSIDEEDRRYQIIRLTNEGQKLFESIFPRHVSHLDNALNHLSEEQKRHIIEQFKLVTQAFSDGKNQ